MTRDGLVERSADSGEEIRISEREQDFDLRQARDSPVYEDMSAEARHSRQHRQKEIVHQKRRQPLNLRILIQRIHRLLHQRNRYRIPEKKVSVISRNLQNPMRPANPRRNSLVPLSCNLLMMNYRRSHPAKN